MEEIMEKKITPTLISRVILVLVLASALISATMSVGVRVAGSVLRFGESVILTATALRT